MSLIAQANELQRSVRLLQEDAEKQQKVFYALVSGVVEFARCRRLVRDYETSDDLREILDNAGILVTNGKPDGPLADHWELKS